MKRLHSEAADVAPVDIAALAERRTALLGRLEEINGPALSSSYVSSVVKSDVHWDHVMQEMVSRKDGYAEQSSFPNFSLHTGFSSFMFGALKNLVVL